MNKEMPCVHGKEKWRECKICNYKLMKSKPEKHCASISCRERFSTCCYSYSEAVSGDEGTGYFRCSMCKKEFRGFPCDAGEKPSKIFDGYEEVRLPCPHGRQGSPCPHCLGINEIDKEFDKGVTTTSNDPCKPKKKEFTRKDIESYKDAIRNTVGTTDRHSSNSIVNSDDSPVEPHDIIDGLYPFEGQLQKELDKQFPKGECKERGQALVLYATAIFLFREYKKALAKRIGDIIK